MAGIPCLRKPCSIFSTSTRKRPANEELVDLAGDEFVADEASLSAAKWQKAEVGWGKPGRDYYDHSPEHHFRPLLLRPGGAIHLEGLYAHAPSRYEFHLGGKWKTFSATAGMQKFVTDNGQARFVVLGDKRELFRSEILKSTAISEIEVDVSDVQVLSLVVETGKDNNFNCWSVWGSPTVSR